MSSTLINASELMEYFLDLSVTLTGFTRFHLQGTGQASVYFNAVQDIIGIDLLQELLTAFHDLDVKAKNSGNYEAVLASGLRSDILGSEKLGPIARNIIKLWYVATWYQLPNVWRETFGTRENDENKVVSPQAYPEGLLWPTIGVTPPGAKPPGYASWTEPPAVSLP